MHWLAKVVVLASVKRLWSLKRSYLTKPSYLAFHYVVARGEVCRRYRSTLDWANRWSTRLNVVCNVRWSFVETHDLVSNACTGNVHFSWNDWQSHCVLAGKSVNVFAHTRLACEGSYLVDPASSHMLVSKIKPCMSKYKHLYCETANGSLNQLSFIWLYFTTWIPVVILELIHAKNPNFWKGCIY